MEPFSSYRGYQVHHFPVSAGLPWNATGYDGTMWFEAYSEVELRSKIDAALDEIPEPVVPSGILK